MRNGGAARKLYGEGFFGRHALFKTFFVKGSWFEGSEMR